MPSTIWGMDKLSLFSGLNPMELHEVNKICTKVRFERGDIVSDIDNQSNDVYVLIEGRVDIVSLRGVSLYRISAGEIFGELAITRAIKRTAVSVAREDSWVLIMNMNHLDTLGQEHPAIQKTITQNLVQSLGIKLARANKLIELLKAELTKSIQNRS